MHIPLLLCPYLSSPSFTKYSPLIMPECKNHDSSLSAHAKNVALPVAWYLRAAMFNTRMRC